MAAMIGLIGAILGAAIVLLGQMLTQRSAHRQENLRLLLESCAEVSAQEEDYRNRVWEERKAGKVGVVDQWNVGAHRLADARVRLLTGRPGIVSALDDIRTTGRDLGKAWRLNPEDDDRVQLAREAHGSALQLFNEECAAVLRVDR